MPRIAAVTGGDVARVLEAEIAAIQGLPLSEVATWA